MASMRERPPETRNGIGTPSDAEIYGQILTAIVEHDIAPGTKLPEDMLAEAFGVSRTRVRKILHQLAHEELLVLERHRGASVARPSPKEARDVFTVRRMLEAGMMRLLADGVSARALARLRQHVAAEREAYARGDRRRAITLSGEFHLELARLTGNDALVGILRELTSRTSLILAVHAPAGGPLCLCDEHESLIDKIRKRDRAGAEAAMLHHLDHIVGSLALAAEDAGPIDLRAVFSRVAARRRGLVPVTG
jgi:DNA-binding GntR family transcriptional regulator